MSVLNTQAVMDAIALLVGGTRPDATNKPGYYSGYVVGDATGITGIKAAFSRPPEVVEEVPACIVLTGRADIQRGVPEVNRDRFRLLLLLARNDAATQYPNVVAFRDLFPDVFDAHMTLNTAPQVLEAHIDSITPVGMSMWAGQDYFSMEFTLRVDRYPIKTYIP